MSAPLEHKVVIFDWDDTLLSSSYLAASGHRLDTTHPFSDELKGQLSILEDAVNKLLLRAFRLVGPENIIIITNAEEGWIQLSSKKFIPNVIGNVRQCRIMSARSTFELTHPGNPFMWKAFAMHFQLQECFGIPLPFPLVSNLIPPADNNTESNQVLQDRSINVSTKSSGVSVSRVAAVQSDKENTPVSSGDETRSSSSSPPSSVSTSPQKTTTTIRHIISFGDSVVEQHAACCVGKLIDRCIVKCVKLMERPSLNQLVKQLNAVSGKLQDVLDHPEPLILSTMHARNIPQQNKSDLFPRVSTARGNV